MSQCPTSLSASSGWGPLEGLSSRGWRRRRPRSGSLHAGQRVEVHLAAQSSHSQLPSLGLHQLRVAGLREEGALSSLIQTHMQCASSSRMKGARLMGVLLTLTGVLHVVLSLRIAAFNIRTFGETKMSNDTLSNYIVQVGPGQCSVLKAPRLSGPALSPVSCGDRALIATVAHIRPPDVEASWELQLGSCGDLERAGLDTPVSV